jgi:Putative glycosyl hydrolase domain
MDDSNVSPTELSHSDPSNVPNESNTPRSDVSDDGKRSVRDGGFAVLLLATAIVAGYAALYPVSLRAKTVATTARPPMMLASIGGADPSWHDVPDAVTTSTEGAPRPETPRLEVKPRQVWPGSVTGRVLGPDRQPAAGASIVLDGKEVRTDATGSFTLSTSSDRALLVKLPGYEKVSVDPTKEPVEVVLKPQVIKAAYLTYYGVGSKTIRTRVLDLAHNTELNAVVVDVKGDRGWIVYRTDVPLALAAGA